VLKRFLQWRESWWESEVWESWSRESLEVVVVPPLFPTTELEIYELYLRFVEDGCVIDPASRIFEIFA
jgi:hypothetical protein